jgi:hypothetical protein
MSRKFITQRELDFISNTTKELLQGVVEEEVRYYAISLERSQVNELYEEAIRKVWSPPVAIDALVLWGQDATRVARFDLDAQYTLEVYFHKKELEERNVKVHEGDFVEYDGKFFEISSATEPQIVFGQVNNKVMVKCTCVVSREGQFAAGADNTRSIRTEKNIENRPGVPQVNRISVDPTPAFNRFRLYPTGSV